MQHLVTKICDYADKKTILYESNNNEAGYPTKTKISYNIDNLIIAFIDDLDEYSTKKLITHKKSVLHHVFQ